MEANASLHANRTTKQDAMRTNEAVLWVASFQEYNGSIL